MFNPFHEEVGSISWIKSELFMKTFDPIHEECWSISNGKSRNNFKPQQSVEKLAEKYSVLGKEALSSGDKILSENYFQHADHFMRILSERKSNQNKIKTETVKSDIQSSEKEDVKINQSITEKKE